MKTIVFVYKNNLKSYKENFLLKIKKDLEAYKYYTLVGDDMDEVVEILEENSRICCIVLDRASFNIDAFHDIAHLNTKLPIFVVSDYNHSIKLNLKDFNLNINFLQYDALAGEDADFINKTIINYFNDILPPFTYELFEYSKSFNSSFCTPGHQGGYGFQRSAVGALFYDFFGENVFKTDLSISVKELGSLLDHSDAHKDAEEYISKVFKSDRSLIVTNGTSTANKIVGMYSVADGDTILVDRNCHKSVTHLMMMVDVNPVYLKPTRNAYGIIGGIPQEEFKKKAIQKKIQESKVADKWPEYAVITNSTYDGILYNTDTIHNELDVKKLHFDSAWIPYAIFHPIYKHKSAMQVDPKPECVIFETQSTHKLLAAFSQSSMLHIKGDYNEEVLNEAFMMHTSTSPFYPIVASTEIAAAMMDGEQGYNLIDKTINLAIDFRKELVKLKFEAQGWFFDVWQPDDISSKETWALRNTDGWHGFKDIEGDFLSLDPLKITILTPGIKDNEVQDWGIPADVVAKFLDEHDIVVEKAGPYSLLFIFGLGTTKAKSVRLISVLNKFKQMYDENALVEKMLPALYAEDPKFYEDKRIKEISEQLHNYIYEANLPTLMYHAFNTLPEQQINPHRAFQKLLKGKVKKVPLAELYGQVSAVMILPYPPGIPVIFPGEKITADSKVILDFLLMLEKIGSMLPGFDTDIHGPERSKDGKLYIKVINE
ncbi:lysine decarboxylase LdcC [Allofrancisella guangzhouensis]|uniref:Lysine decarboxylase LdcC n=1 Tax=Allofrancisella guangzhouensis TaxID=594679 RepID=A0A0A8EAS3_9GAMM|nr:lysine decarboxylase LdcC [Allofrancisella guangzhouensis]AJC49281.1 lysine decarboxylase LdcC [Allofrancisella guangzhouensis]MBK2027726.1 lysine decarboxylase LdcC [Allofrancisella guangzhouensis]MBK2044001.1 lysine decarboxylase LdcC [Allofrancisella guangzhouensis]MBK2046385.1 lysine decarboxylase LdcC [Allofrancisella guangzhouensis]